MRRDLMWALIAVALGGAAVACGKSADTRARDVAVRARREEAVREMPTVERVTIPADSGRLIYDPPPDLSASTPGRPGVAINGADTSTRKPDSAHASTP